MHLNRMFRSCHREQEAVLCELLNRAYASGLGRDRNERLKRQPAQTARWSEF
jgi:hypothetical protein